MFSVKVASRETEGEDSKVRGSGKESYACLCSCFVLLSYIFFFRLFGVLLWGFSFFADFAAFFEVVSLCSSVTFVAVFPLVSRSQGNTLPLKQCSFWLLRFQI